MTILEALDQPTPARAATLRELSDAVETRNLSRVRGVVEVVLGTAAVLADRVEDGVNPEVYLLPAHQKL